MDEKKLKEILSEDIAPKADDNARKRAVNLAVAEFKAQEIEKNKKTSQGNSLFARLIGKSNAYERRKPPMKQRNTFLAGTALASMAAVLVVGTVVTQKTYDITKMPEGAGGQAAQLQSVEFKTDEAAPSFIKSADMSEEDFERAVMYGTSAMPQALDPNEANILPDYDEESYAVEGKDEEILERAVQTGGSAIPVPIEAPEERLRMPDEAQGEEGPLTRWRNLQDERVEREMVARQSGEGVPSKDDRGNLADAEEPLHKWRRIQEERPEKKMTQRQEIISITPLGEDEQVAQASVANESVAENIAKPQRSLLGSLFGSAKDNAAEGDAVAGRSAPLFNKPSTEKVIAPAPDIMPPVYQDQNRDKFEEAKPSPFKMVAEEPVSTFSSDVDTASYSFVRKQLNMGRLPDRDAVRVEEMVNYFDYAYPHATDKAAPFKPTVVIMDSPWAEGKKLMHIGVKGYEINEKPRSNLVFLLDTSGSMNAPDKLPLVKSSMKMLLDSLNPDDTVAIAVYAGSAGTVLEPTKVRERSKIFNALDRLGAGGSTAGAAGLKLAYQLAEQNFDQEAVNRVILATDGDFNVGMSNHEDLKEYIEEKRDNGVYLSVLGFGSGNLNDQLMQALAQNGNGVAAYIDNLNEARKVLVEEATSSLFPIAKDVKFQVEFNPNTVAEYRLIGYETRALKREDFNNDKVDAGDIGAGHTVTAIYEFVPVGSSAVSVDPLRYGAKKPAAETDIPEGNAQEYAYLKMRYKLPSESKSKLITTPVGVGGGADVYDFTNTKYDLTTTVNDLQREALFASAVAGFGQILKHDNNLGDLTMDDVIKMAQIGKGDDPFGYRAEFIQLVRLAKTFKR